MTAKFKVGDRVRLKSDCPYPPAAGVPATVTGLDPNFHDALYGHIYQVRFDRKLTNHALGDISHVLELFLEPCE